MKQDNSDKKERLRAAFIENRVHVIRVPIVEHDVVLQVQKLVMFSDDEIFAVFFQHEGFDERGDVRRLEREMQGLARRNGVRLLSPFEVIDAGGAEVLTEFRTNAWKCEK